MEEALTINLIAAIETATTTKNNSFSTEAMFFKDPKLLKPEVKESPSFRKNSKPRFKKSGSSSLQQLENCHQPFFVAVKMHRIYFFLSYFWLHFFSTWLWGSRSMVEIFQHSRLLGSILAASSSSVSLSLSLSLSLLSLSTLSLSSLSLLSLSPISLLLSY